MQQDWIWGLIGGGLIGTAGAIFLLINGRVMGASGIIGGLVDGSGVSSWLERAAFLLHDVFDYGQDEIAGVLETSVPNSRQIVKRARDRVHAGRPRFEVSDAERVRLRDQFMATCERADLDGLLALFTDDIAITSDGGGKAKAALNVVRGADKVARFLLGLMKKAPPGTTWTRARINTEPGMLVHIDGALFASFAFDMADGRIQGIAAVLNPDKLPSEAGVGAA